jgi:hypothetical protein
MAVANPEVLHQGTLAPGFYREADLEEVDKTGVRPGVWQHYQPFFDWDKGVAVRVGTDRLQGYFAPRHKHVFDQVRYILSGKIKYGPHELSEGDCIYTGESVSYGPSNTERGAPDLHEWIIQFSGPSGIPYLPPSEILRAQTELSNDGTFDNGVYKRDGKNIDSVHAIYTYVLGHEPVYPQPRYRDPVIMRADNLPWEDCDEGTNLQIRRLASFNTVGPRISILRFSANSRLPMVESNLQQAMGVVRGTIQYAGTTYEKGSFGYFPADSAGEAITSQGEGEVLRVEWSRVGGPTL